MLLVMLSLFLGACLADGGQVKMLTVAEYHKLQSQPGIQVIYFKKRLDNLQEIVQEEVSSNHELLPQYDDRTLGLFYKEYSESAKVLAQYDVNLYMVDCEKEKVKQYCNKDDSHHNVYMFRGGTELISLGLDSMFDVDAIVSNILQIVLLHEVPILQSHEERQRYEDEYRGFYDIIFSFQVAIGTRQHRTFVEVAYKYQKKYKFAVTTEIGAVTGLPDIPKSDEAGVWILQCKGQGKSSGPCPAARYYGKHTVDNLSQFLNDINTNNKYELTPENMDSDPFPGTKLHQVLVFCDDESAQFVHLHANNVLKQFRGSIGMIFINIDEVKNPYEDLIKNQNIPALGFKNANTGDIVFMPANMEPEPFIKQQLQRSSGRTSVSNQHSVDEGYESDLDGPRKHFAEVEKQDDEVAIAMFHLDDRFSKDNSLLALTDKTFPMETKDRDLLIVVFYLPFDAMSSAVHRTFVAVADILTEKKQSNPLASVNCYDWTDVCAKENVTSWPVIRVYRKGHDFREHKMIVSIENILRTVLLYEVPAPLEVKSVEELKEFKDGRIPNSHLEVEAVTIALVKDKNDNEAKMLSDVASNLHGHVIVGMASGAVAQKISELEKVPVPSVVVFKKNDPFQPKTFTEVGSKTPDELESWIRQATLPVLMELTPLILPKIYTTKKPIVIYFSEAPTSSDISPESKEMHQLLGKLAAEGDLTNVAFTWMDKSKEITQEVMMSYTGDNKKDQLVVVKLTKGQVFTYSDKMTDLASLNKWLKAVSESKMEPNNLLPVGDWKPRVPPYDFIKLMEEDVGYHKDRDRIGHALSDEEEIITEIPPFGDDGVYPTEDGMIKPVGSDIMTESASDSVHPRPTHTEL